MKLRCPFATIKILLGCKLSSLAIRHSHGNPQSPPRHDRTGANSVPTLWMWYWSTWCCESKERILSGCVRFTMTNRPAFPLALASSFTTALTVEPGATQSSFWWNWASALLAMWCCPWRSATACLCKLWSQKNVRSFPLRIPKNRVLLIKTLKILSLEFSVGALLGSCFN